MDLKLTTLNDFKVIALAERLDTTNAPFFEKFLLDLIEGGSYQIILDCSGLNYISSSGLRVFLLIQKRLAPVNGRFHLCCLQPGIQEIFDISGFSTIFPVFPDVETAAGRK